MCGCGAWGRERGAWSMEHGARSREHRAGRLGYVVLNWSENCEL